MLDKAEQNINQGIQLLREISKEGSQNKGREDQIELSSNAKKRKKRTYLALIQKEESQETSDQSKSLINNNEVLFIYFNYNFYHR